MSFVGIQYELTKQKSKRVAEAICGSSTPFDEAPTYAPFILVAIIKEWLSSISDDNFESYFDSLQPDFDDEVPVAEVVEAFRYLRRSVTASANAEVASKLIDTHSLSASIENRLIDAWGAKTTIDYAAPRAFFEANDRIKTYERVVEALTLAWSRLAHHLEEAERAACTPTAQAGCDAPAP